VPAACPACGAESAEDAAFCGACGRPLFTLPPVAIPPGPRLIGEIPHAWSDSARVGTGPVRIAVTDQQTFVIAAGKSSFFPSWQLYREWESALAGEPHVRFISGPWLTPTEPIRWAIDNAAVGEVRVSRSFGIGVAKGLCGLLMWARSAGIRGANPYLAYRKWVRFIWRVPGQPEEIRAFLVQLPFGSVVNSK
jgi:hypothetical protein